MRVFFEFLVNGFCIQDSAELRTIAIRLFIRYVTFSVWEGIPARANFGAMQSRFKILLEHWFSFFSIIFFFFSINAFLLPEACSTDPNGLKPKLFPKLRRSYSLPCFGPRRVYSLLDSPAEFPLASLDSFWLQWHVWFILKCLKVTSATKR